MPILRSNVKNAWVRIPIVRYLLVMQPVMEDPFPLILAAAEAVAAVRVPLVIINSER